MSYEKEFQVFSDNIRQAARSFYYHQEIQRQVYQDGIKNENMPNGHFQNSKLFQAMQANSQFWMDHKYSSIVYTIIILGRIFDKNKNSHKIERLLKTAEKSDLFKKEKLRKRKISGSDNAQEWIDDYMTRVHEFSADDFYEIQKFSSETKKKWNDVKDLRNKIYAHQEDMDDHKKAKIFEQSKYSVFEEIIKRLLTIESIFWEAFHNGKKPDFDYQDTKTYEIVKEDVASLLERLSK